ncbi:molybdate ABC transporter substrate-binding protein [Kribbella sp. NPDC023855]|uniref:molybdate ABC transporter substrate-binding protein n=1 Tax=Kribbella sp. NPDC023855 TaxID=3154698 RepID=UPI0033C9DA04
MFRRTVAAVLAALTLVSCGGNAPADPAGLSGTINVFAAASLTGTFTQLGKDFEAAHPGVKVVFNFAGSSALAQQINQGAPADVFASAAPKNMDQVKDKGAPATFARNKLEIAVPKGNPAGVKGLTDFTDKNRKLALCAEQVPCGAAAKKVFEAAKLTPEPDSLEQDVKAALTKVTLGEVDAALVYKTDILAAKAKVDGIPFPEAEQAVNDYPITTLTTSKNPTTANAFVSFVLSPAAQKTLTTAGFETP